MIIDTHVHIGGEAVGFDMTEEKVINAVRKYGIDHILLSNSDSAEVDHSQKVLPEKYLLSQEESLRRAIDMARRYPGLISIAAWVRPYLQQPTEELEQLIKDNIDIVKAIKLHPFHSKTAPDSERGLPFIELADKYNLAVVSHTDAGVEGSPEHLYNVAKMFPNIPFVMVHMGLGSDNSLALDLLGKADNLYGDTTWVPMSTTIEAVKRYGSGKIVFGSDMPVDGEDTYLCNPKGERSVYQDYFHVLPELISKEAYEAIMFRNAIRLFKIKDFTN